MSEDGNQIKPEGVDTALGEMHLEEGGPQPEFAADGDKHNGHEMASPTQTDIKNSRSPSPKPSLTEPKSEDNESEDDEEDKIDGEIELKIEPGKAPKLSRKSSQKVISRPPQLFDDLPDSTEEAISNFQVIRDCIYGSKHMGSSEHDALGCDCSEEWIDGENRACGEDSDCINRATKMECIDDECNCGALCQNQRFQRKQFANVSVIKTEKKGYGLRTDSALQANDFIFEYIGEVINEPTFRRRTIQYDDEGIKHFYFMSLTKSEFVDATKKGNLGRFCNHSCNPNCYVDKWVVGDKLRMGIFAERNIQAGEELVFNYNVDRYGADPQPCYCAEPNCTGFIGGKTQTERATKLSHTTIEALGIDDGDGWDTAISKKPRKKKSGEDDEEYVSSLQPRGLDEDGVTKVMATLMQCKEKWIAVKLLSRIQRCDDDRVRNRVVRMHGYQILRTTLTTWVEDNNVVLQVLDILYKFPRLTRNKISDSKIEATIEGLKTSEHEDVASESSRLIEEWSKLEVAYRIPRKKFDPNAQQNNSFDRRGDNREEEAPKTPAVTAAIVAPTGPKGSIPQRGPAYYAAARPVARRGPLPLPSGWFTALDASGNTYYYSKSGQTTWQRPRIPAVEQPQKNSGLKVSDAVQKQKALQDIIDSLTKPEAVTPTPSSGTPQPVEAPAKEKKKVDKWRSLPLEKQMKLYENTLFPHIKYVMDKFRHKLPKEDLKKFAKEIGKKLVASDFKNNRVEDPTKITPKQEKKVKKYVKDFFDKAVAKKAAHDKAKAEKKAKSTEASQSKDDDGVTTTPTGSPMKIEPDDEIEVSGDEEESELVEASLPATPALATPNEENLKRKREDLGELYDSMPDDTPFKRVKDEEDMEPSPPPPPPPPPAEEMQIAMEMDEDADLAAQEEALMRENEEALIRENEEALKDAEAHKANVKAPLPGSIDEVDVAQNGIVKGDAGIEDVKMEEPNGNGTPLTLLGLKDLAQQSSNDVAESNGVSVDEKIEAMQHERKQVLSH